MFFSLGTWQKRRLGEAAAYRQQFERRLEESPFDAAQPPADPRDRRAWVQGLPLWDRMMWVAGKQMFQQPGYQLILPVKTLERVVLVDIGWVPQDEAAAIVQLEQAVPGERRYEGLVRAFKASPRSRAAFPKEQGFQRLWAERDPLQMFAELGEKPVDWLLTDGAGLAMDAPILDRVPPISGWRAEPYAPPHLHYAITWFSLFGLMFVLWLTLCFQKIAPPQVVSVQGLVVAEKQRESAPESETERDR